MVVGKENKIKERIEEAKHLRELYLSKYYIYRKKVEELESRLEFKRFLGEVKR